MTFVLPIETNLHTSNADQNVGSIGGSTTLILRQKTAGNLPITTASGRVQFNPATGAEGVFFGTIDSTTPGSVDSSTDAILMIWSVQFNSPNRIQIDSQSNGGIRFWLGSGSSPTSNYKEFYIGGNDTPFASAMAGPVTICIDLSDTSNENTIGTFDASDISAYGIGTLHFAIAGVQYGEIHTQRSFLLDTKKSGVNLPHFEGTSNFDDAVTTVQGTSYTNKIGNWVTKSGSSFFIPCPFAFGDDSSGIAFDDNGASVVSPASNATNQENFRITDDAMRVYLKTPNTNADTVTLSGSYTWGTAAPWDFGQNKPLAVCTLSGTFSGMGEFLMGPSVIATGTFNLAAGSDVVSTGANLDGATVQRNVTINGTTVDTFVGLTVGRTLKFATAGTYYLTNCEIGITIVNLSGGNITVQLDNTFVNNANTDPTITIIQAPRTLTLKGLQANSEVRVYESGTTTEIAGIENSTTQFTDATIAVNSVDIVIHHIEYEYIRLEAVDVTADVALPIQQQFDRGYRNE